jgi:GntR family transcriptional regulator
MPGIASDPGSKDADRRRGLGLAHDVRERLLAGMRSGAWADGRLPPEAELARELGVSRTTVRAALHTLAEDGIVSRRRRHGTIVNEHMLHNSLPLNRLLSFRDLVEQSGHDATVDPLVRRVEVAAAPVAEALRLDADDECLVIERLLRAGGRPAIAVTDVLPLRWLAMDADAVPDADTTFSLIAAATNVRVDHSVVEIVPRVATADAPAHLGLPAGTPYAELREVIFSPLQEPVAFSGIAVDCRRVPLTLVRREV